MTDLDKRLAHRKLNRQLRSSLSHEAAEAARINQLRTARVLFERGMER